jgi:hypothetical protein
MPTHAVVFAPATAAAQVPRSREGLVVGRDTPTDSSALLIASSLQCDLGSVE